MGAWARHAMPEGLTWSPWAGTDCCGRWNCTAVTPVHTAAGKDGGRF